MIWLTTLWTVVKYISTGFVEFQDSLKSAPVQLSPTEMFLMTCVIFDACKLLLKTDFQVKEVLEVAYSNDSHYTFDL